MNNPENDYYSKNKIFHHKSSLYRIAEGGIPAPRQVQIDICNPCSHNCRFCYYSCESRGEDADNKLELFNPRDVISTKKMFEIIDDLRSIGVGAVSLTGGGEPTLHSDFKKIVERINSRRMKWSLTTNGSLIHKRRLSDTIATATWIRFSMDAATEDTFNKCQRPTDKTDYGCMLTTVRNACMREERPVVGLSFVLNPLNYEEVYDFIKLGKRLGVDNVRISLAYTSKKADIHKPYIEGVKNQVERAKSEFSDDNFRIFTMLDRYEDLSAKCKNYKTCNFHYFTCAIGADLNIYSCCTTKYLKRYVIGSMKNKTFSEVWFGKEHQEFVKNLNVKSCPPCWFDAQNKVIENVLVNGIDEEIRKLDDYGKLYVTTPREKIPHVDWV